MKDFFRKSPRDLWFLLTITLIESIVIFNVYSILMWILTENCNFKDEIAGLIFGLFSFSVAFYGFLFGPLLDKLLLRKTLFLQVCLGLIGKLILTFSLHPIAVCIALFGPMALGLSLAHPCICVGLMRYCRFEYRKLAFALRYVIMNGGSLISFGLIDLFRIVLRPYAGTAYFLYLPLWSFFLGCNIILDLPVLLIILLGGIRDIEVVMVEGGGAEEETQEKHQILEPMTNNGQPTSIKELAQKYLRILKDPLFRRLVLLSFALIGANSVFVYDSSLYPLYMKRAPFPVDNPEDFPFETLMAIDPFIVITLTFLSGFIVQKFAWDPYWVILAGTAIGAGSPFFMMITQYWAVALSIILGAVAESVWSYLYESYSTQFTKHGDEGIYFGLAGMTTTISKVVISLSSGLLLQRFCQAKGQCFDGPTIWLIIGFIATATPFLLLITKRWTHIRIHDEPYIPMIDATTSSAISSSTDEDDFSPQSIEKEEEENAIKKPGVF
jgi:MFS family permease